jgi:hypothetical protein
MLERESGSQFTVRCSPFAAYGLEYVSLVPHVPFARSAYPLAIPRDHLEPPTVNRELRTVNREP